MLRLLTVVAIVAFTYWLFRRLSATATQRPKTSSSMGVPTSRAEALAVLGLAEGASRDEIVAAHRQLIQKLHPDRGGNAFLAAQINRAREILLDH